MPSNKAVIDLDAYLRDIRDTVQSLPDVNEAYVTGSAFTPDDFDKISHQRGLVNVLLYASGGQINSNGNGVNAQHWVNCNFGLVAFCERDDDVNTIGYSSQAIGVTQQLLQLISSKEIGKDYSGALDRPKITDFTIIPDDVVESNSFVIWHFRFVQRLRIA